MGAGAAGEGSAGEVAVEAGTLAVGVNRLMRLVCLPLAVVGFPEGLGRLRGRSEPSMNGVPNLPGCEAGLLAKAERSSSVFCRSSSYGTSSGSSVSLGLPGGGVGESSSEAAL